MTIPLAYLSFDSNHNIIEKSHFTTKAIQSKAPFDIANCTTNSRIHKKNWEKLVEEKIKKCNLLIVLVGENMHTSTQTAKEIEIAKINNVPVFGIYVGFANTTSALPNGLQRKRTIFNDLKKLGFAIEQVMKEGKNKNTYSYQ